jgi:hypothetical protein
MFSMHPLKGESPCVDVKQFSCSIDCPIHLRVNAQAIAKNFQLCVAHCNV